MRLTKLFLAAAAPLACLAPLMADDEAPAPAVKDLIPDERITDAAKPFTDFNQLLRTEVARQGRGKDELAANQDEDTRGLGQFVYPEIAPAVVVVMTYYGHGTGFFIREDGWLLTNRHVVEDADYSRDLNGQVVQINVGTLDKDGWMHVIDQPIPALVYKSDIRADLALLKLLEMPPGMEQVPVIKFAEKTPMPGEDVVAVGHPAAGTLWTLRSGELAGVGIFPDDQMDQILYLLSISSGDRAHFEQSLKNDPERKRVFLSTCGLNPGDSGGPLVNDEGELVAVSYAVPTIDTTVGVDRGKFSFHIHLEEVDDFLSLWPDEPIVPAPNPLPGGMYYELQDADQDGYFDTMVISMGPGEPPVGVLLDLDGDSYGGKSIKQLELMGAYIDETGFDFEFVASAYPRVRISYDTNNDGEIDLVFSDEDHDEIPDTRLAFADSEWTLAEITTEPVNPRHFLIPRLQKRFSILNQTTNP